MDDLHPITVTVRNARKLSGLGNTTLYKMIARGELETVLVGRRRLIVVQSLIKKLQPPRPDATPEPRRRGRPRKAEASDASAVSTSEPHA